MKSRPASCDLTLVVSLRKKRRPEGEKRGILSGLVPLVQPSPAQLALLSSEELKFLANTRYRDSSHRQTNINSIYICEQSVGYFAYLFPSEDAELRHQDKITRTIWQAWNALMPESEIKSVDELIKKAHLRKVTTSPGRTVPGPQISLRGS